jgi:inorganic triphosphatase YgiF
LRPSTASASRPRADTDGSTPDSGPGTPVEIEAKLAVLHAAPIRALIDQPDPARLAGFAADGPERTDEILDRYLDTEPGGGALRTAGLRARLRIGAAGVVLAVKGRSSAAPDGLTTRKELEAPAVNDLDPVRWPPSEPRGLVMATVGDAPLVEVAALRQRRYVRLVRRAGTVVELSLDELVAVHGATELASRVELEAELKAGSAEDLAELVAALRTLEGVGPPLGSKLDFALGARRRPA